MKVKEQLGGIYRSFQCHNYDIILTCTWMTFSLGHILFQAESMAQLILTKYFLSKADRLPIGCLVFSACLCVIVVQ